MPRLLAWERVDDIAILMGLMIRMGLIEVIDRHIPAHGNSRDLSWGWTLAIWLTCCASTGNHQKLPVRELVSKRIHTLSSLWLIQY